MKIATNFWQILRNAKHNILPVLLCLGVLVSGAAAKSVAGGASLNENAATSNNNFAPYATFQRLWIDYNVTQGGQKGMRIHTAFKAYNMKGIPSYLALYFQERDGTPLRDRNGKFNSADDTVAAYYELLPAYNPAVYEDLAIFMPYDELDLAPGSYELRIDASVIYKQGGLITRLTYYNFDYSDSSSTKTPSGTFQRMWIEYNITENGRKGMRIHTAFTVYDMKDIPGYLALYFQYKNGTPIRDKNDSYNSSDGNVAAYREITPAYNPAVYEDFTIFMPYDELDLPSGNYQLQIDAKVIYKEGGAVAELTKYPFVYNKK
jgi:hypothetical protein